jgi:cell division initiation protein
MRLTPIDINHKTFGKTIMGFDPKEVQQFLYQISSAVEELIRERNSLREVLREKDIALIEYKEKDQVLKSTITTATQMTDKIRADTEREAKIILNDAQQKADTIVRDARDSLKKLYQDIIDMKKARAQFEANLKAMVQAHLTLLEQSEKYMPQPAFPQNASSFTAAGENLSPRVSPAHKSTDISPLSAG